MTKPSKEKVLHQRVLEYELTLRVACTKLENLDTRRIEQLIVDRLSGLWCVIGSRTPVEIGVGIRVKPEPIEERLSSLESAVNHLLSKEE